MAPKAQISKQKRKVIETYVDLISKYPIVGSVNMEGLPTAQLQKMRAQLRGKVEIVMAKRRLIKIALKEAEKVKPGVSKLDPYLKGMPALIFTKENPFSLYKTLQKNKSNAPAKSGQEAPSDVVVPEGPTSFAPGPIISELGNVGIKAGIENGKVIVKEDSTVIKEGEKFNAALASLLTRLGIEPMEIGLDLVATFEDGDVFTKSILAVDEKEYMDNISTLASQAFNLAMFVDYPCSDTIVPMISKAAGDARNLAVNKTVFEKDIIGMILGKAEREALGVSSLVPN